MVYAVGERSFAYSINSMIAGNTSERVNMIVGFDDPKTGGRYVHIKDGSGSKLVKVSGRNNDPADWREFVDFGKWAKSNFPAKKYVLLVAGHGSAWWNDTSKPMTPNKGIGYDTGDGSGSSNYITTVELGMALREISGVDVLLLNSCGQQTIELAYEVSDSVKVIAGGETVTYRTVVDSDSAAGNRNFRMFMERISSNPLMTNEEIGKFFVLALANRLDNPQEVLPGTLSALKTENLATFAEHIRSFVSEATKEDNLWLKNCVKKTYAIPFYERQSDLIEFVKIVTARTKNEQLKTIGKTLTDYYENKILIFLSRDTERLHGVSIYLPLEWYDSDYNELRFKKDTGWARLIGAY